MNTDDLIKLLTFLGGGTVGAGGWLVAWLLWKAKRADEKEILLTLKNNAIANTEVANAIDELRTIIHVEKRRGK